MKINGEFEIKCPGCQLNSKIRLRGVKAPQRLFPTTIYVSCENCQSELFVKLHVAKGQIDRTKLQLQYRLNRASPALVEMLREEAEHKSRPMEETANGP